MTVHEGNDNPVRSEVIQTRQRIGCETRLRLFAIRDDRRAGLRETRQGVAQGLCIQGVQGLARRASGLESDHCLDEFKWTGYAADRFSLHDGSLAPAVEIGINLKVDHPDLSASRIQS